jgi:hypothetical protein
MTAKVFVAGVGAGKLIGTRDELMVRLMSERVIFTLEGQDLLQWCGDGGLVPPVEPERLRWIEAIVHLV